MTQQQQHLAVINLTDSLFRPRSTIKHPLFKKGQEASWNVMDPISLSYWSIDEWKWNGLLTYLTSKSNMKWSERNKEMHLTWSGSTFKDLFFLSRKLDFENEIVTCSYARNIISENKCIVLKRGWEKGKREKDTNLATKYWQTVKTGSKGHRKWKLEFWKREKDVA